MSGSNDILVHKHSIDALIRTGISSKEILEFIENFSRIHYVPRHLQVIAAHEMREYYLKITKR